MDAIAAGKDVYSEKPMTYRSSEGIEIINAARAADRIVQVGSQGVSSDTDKKAKDLILSGKLGKEVFLLGQRALRRMGLFISDTEEAIAHSDVEFSRPQDFH